MAANKLFFCRYANKPDEPRKHEENFALKRG